MNISVTVKDLEDERFRKLLAPSIYLIILMVIGIPGNLTVLIIFGREYTKSVYQTIVWNIALCDQIFCMVCIPFNIARVIRYYSFEGKWVCVFFVTFIYFLIMYSTHLIMLLSLYRFRKICMPFKSQMTNNNVKYFIMICLVVALVLSSPQLALSKYEEISLKHNITGHSCAISLSNPSVSSIAFSYGFLTLFILYTVVLIVIYLTIGIKLYYHRQEKIRNESTPDNSRNKAISNKMTKIALTVSAVFGLSYIPVFVVQTTDKKIEEEYLSAFEFSALRIVERLYVINHVANPFIYGIFDKHFRLNLRRLIKMQFNEKNRKTARTLTSKQKAGSSGL